MNHSHYRKFGLTLGFIFLLIALWTYFYYSQATLIFLGISVTLCSLACVFPNALRPIEWLWRKLGLSLGFINSRIIMTLIYWIFFTPLAIFFRWIGRDEMKMRLDPKAESYWEEHKGRFPPMTQQF